MSKQAIADFELTASPAHWLEIAKDLNEHARLLRRSDLGTVQFTNAQRRTTLRPRTNRGVFLMAGFALENLLKGYLIFENPNYVANGILSKTLRTHRLTRLRRMSRYAPYKNRYEAVLSAFEDGLESWARYPCGLTHQGKSYEELVTPELWAGYSTMFVIYQGRLEKLLTKTWRAPSGGEYEMRYE
jgi:hypothetical protein